MLDANLPKVRLAGVQLSEIEAAIPAIDHQVDNGVHALSLGVDYGL
ncbi:MAG TPA: hypothetical protein VML57_02560 [Burkholderiales bacterium]|nr:hypothetical protein [Burkholderiales bacterium]